MNIRRQTVGGFVLALGTSLASGQTLTVNDPRPMMAMVDKLQDIVNVPINYEDPRFENPGDVQDVTDTVVKNRAQFSGRVLIPKGGQLTVTVPNSAAGITAGDLLSIFPMVQTAHAENAYPGTFQLANRNGSWYVEPTALRGLSGTTKAVGSVMATKIRFALRQQSAAEALQLILSQVSQAIGVKIGIGSVPFSALANTISLGADDEPASAVLARLFGQLHPGDPLASESPRWAYRLLFDPGLRYYMFNTSPVTTDAPVKTPAASLPQPSGEGKGVRKQ